MRRLQKPFDSWVLVAALLVGLAGENPALAHKPSDSYLTLYLGADWESEEVFDDAFVSGTWRGRWDLALRDLEIALELDEDGDGNLTWGEVRRRQDDIASYGLARLDIELAGEACRLEARELLIDNHSDGAYGVLPFDIHCPGIRGSGADPGVGAGAGDAASAGSGRVAESTVAGKSIVVNYRFLFDLDPTHRGLLQVRGEEGVQSAILSPQASREVIDLGSPDAWRQGLEYWREGVWHIWIGFDHILFLLVLLLPAVLIREGRRWRRVPSFRPALGEVIRIVTAFTIAHSLTLSVAVLGWISLPSRWVESAIAATVVLAAVNNFVPVFRGRPWVVAFVLGLIHGFGFAGVLVDLGLPAGALALSLLGFNLGVETGQLAIVAVFLPLAFLLRGTGFYRRGVVGVGSLAIAAIALLWLVERSLGFQLAGM
ncbi:MAG: HupE/UreJ family protein [Deltaproteobacteria bacterium]|nr:HupE/UreJ family protein [Deltaproteobacteria bacterium]